MNRPIDKGIRLTLLRYKLSAMPLTFSKNIREGVLDFIAERITSNFDCLEAALYEVGSFALLHGKAPTVPEVEVLLRHYLQKEEERQTGLVQIPWTTAPSFDQLFLMS